MGFIDSATTITVTTKLTNIGREKILQNNNTIFSHFVLGDSDANYQTSESLPTGLIPTASGDLGQDHIMKGIIGSKLYVNNTMTTRKPVESKSSNVTKSVNVLGERTVSGDSLTYVELDRNDNSSEFTNFFSSLSLPIISTDISTFTKPAQSGGWSDTAFNTLSASTVLLASINKDEYGEIIDGKNIKIDLPIITGYTSGGTATGMTTYEIYSTFPTTTIPRTQLDQQYQDMSTLPTSLFGNNISVSYLVSDSVQRPNNDPTKSWSTGYETYKPFSVNNKELININTITTNNVFADRVLGVAYLDKGFLAFTDSEIVDNIALNYTGDTDTNIVINPLGMYSYSASTFSAGINSIDNDVVQNILCMAGRDEFYRTQNKTKGLNDEIRISEIAITDASGTVLAVGKFDRQIIKKKNDLVVLDVRIVV